MGHHQPAQADDVPLSGGRMTSGIVRRGDQLRRPTGPWSPAVHEFLRHLEAAGFEGSPRVLEIDGEWEVLTYLDGDVAVDPHRKAILPALTQCTLAGAESIKYRPVNAVDAARSLEFLARELRWLQDISADLARAL
jgi:hypothetical protein